MVFQLVSSFIKVAKLVLGIPQKPDWNCRARYILAHPTIPKAIEWADEARSAQNHELNRQLAALKEEQERCQEAPRPEVPTEDRPKALLKGSPKALGWDVDEAEEEAAWRLLMADAVENSVYDVTAEVDSKDAAKPDAASSQKEFYRNYLEQWDEQRTTLVWKINVSLTGDHTWTLVPRESDSPKRASEHAASAQAGQASNVEHEVAVLNASTRSRSSTTGTQAQRSFSDAEVQAPVDGHTPIGAQEPLAEIPPLLEVGLEISRPPTPASSIASKASKIPRLGGLRRDSVASLFDLALTQAEPAPMPAPVPVRPSAVSIAAAPAFPTHVHPDGVVHQGHVHPLTEYIGRAPSSLAKKRSSSPAPSLRSVTARLMNRRQSTVSMRSVAAANAATSAATNATPNEPKSSASSIKTTTSGSKRHHSHSHSHSHTPSSPPKLQARMSQRMKSAVKAMGRSVDAAEAFRGMM